MANPTDWKSSLFYRPPTVDGMKELNALIACPQELTRITGLEPRWTSALLSLQAHGSHNDGRHLETDNSFHTFTDLHYRTGFSKVQKATQDDRLNNWHSRITHTDNILNCIFDLVRSPIFISFNLLTMWLLVHYSRQVNRQLDYRIAPSGCNIPERRHCTRIPQS